MTSDDVMRGRERRWWCSYCDTFYAEYVNGCPRCHLGDPGTSTSVVLVWATKDADGQWHRIMDAALLATLAAGGEG